MYDDVPFVVLLKRNPRNSRETFQDTEETLRPVIIKKVAEALSNCNFEHGFEIKYVLKSQLKFYNKINLVCLSMSHYVTM